MSVKRSNLQKRLLSEFLGSFFIIFISCSFYLLNIKGSFPEESNIYLSPLIYAIVIFIMMLSVGSISGAHFNPLITLGFWFNKQIKAKDLLVYIFGQLSGGISALVLLITILEIPESFNIMIPNQPLFVAFLLEFIFSFFLVLIALSVSENFFLNNIKAALSISLFFFLSGIILTPISGGYLNFVRFFSTALIVKNFQFIGFHIFTTMAGAIIASIFYRLTRVNQEEMKAIAMEEKPGDDDSDWVIRKRNEDRRDKKDKNSKDRDVGRRDNDFHDELE